jgi:oxalate decarboxylase
VPLGYGHYLENVGEDPVEVVIVFNNGTYEDISVTQWFAGNSADLLGANFGVAPSTFAEFPKQGVFIAAEKG